MKKILTSYVLFFAMNAFALKSWNAAVTEILPSFSGIRDSSYVSSISSPGPKAGENLIADYDEDSYLLIDHCADIVDDSGINFKKGAFSVKSLSEKLTKKVDHDGVDRWHWMLFYEMEYTVTCGNNITYNGIFKWRVQLWSCQVGCDDNVDTKTYSLDVGSYDYSTNTFEPHRERAKKDGKNVVPIMNLLAAWNGREVAYPKYQGGVNKLAVPVLLVPGFQADYKNTWGVEIPNSDKNSTEFQNGMVTAYLNGGLPDILARYQGLTISRDEINSNGIYFFNAPVDKNGKQPSPEWVNGSASSSISFALYEKLQEKLTLHFGEAWKTDEHLKIDIVAHSQGGLVVREMLRGLNEHPENYPTGTANAANHIRKLVSVNTPHLGTPIADSREDLSAMPEYSSIATLLDDIENQHELEKNAEKMPAINRDKVLFEADLDVPWERLIKEGAGAAWNREWWKNVLIGFLGSWETASVITMAGAFLGYETDVSIKMRGNYLGDYETRTRKKTPLMPADNDDKKFQIGALKNLRDIAFEMHQQGSHLGERSDFIKRLNFYPLLPNGKPLPLQPMYSYDMRGLKNYYLGQIQEGASAFCTGDEEVKDFCVDAVQILNEYLKHTENVEAENVAGIYELANFINTLSEQWLSKTDLLVPVESQKFGYEESVSIPEFHKPRTYGIYLSQTPDVSPVNLVLHGNAIGEFKQDVDALGVSIQSVNIPGASRMGLDLLCALDSFLCPEDMDEGYFLKIPTLVKNGVVVTPVEKAKPVSVQELAVSGDFSLKPLYLTPTFQGIGFSIDGGESLVAAFDENLGTYVWYRNASGIEHLEILTNNRTRWQVGLKRNGNLLEVFANSYDGKEKKWQIPVSLPENVDVQIYGDAGASAVAAILGGSGTAADVATQERPQVTTPRIGSEKDVVVLHYEAGLAEKNTSRPRFVVAKGGESAVEGFKIAYYFTADPAREPVAEIDYPKYPIHVEHLGGDQWRFILDLSSETILPQSIHPDNNGYQIRLHYRDWSPWNHRHDYSADRNVGYPKLNDKIVVYDLEGNILWGVPPALAENLTVDEKKSVSLDYTDAGSFEPNLWRPEFKLKNTGSISLQNFKIRAYIQSPDGKNFSQPTEDWFTPESSPKLSRLAGNVWQLEIAFDSHILYPGQSVSSGNIGVHLTDWSAFGKELLGLVVVDSNGEILWGTPWDGSGVIKYLELADVRW